VPRRGHAATLDGGAQGAVISPGDLSLVHGQEAAKRALEVALAGGHHALFIGPPGAGKSMLGRCIPGLLPPLTPAEAEEVAAVYHLARLQPPLGRPVRIPRPGIGAARLVGSCTGRRPGEVSLAHCGVLVLDELPAFGNRTLDALRAPMDDGEVSFYGSPPLPARFTLFATMNPCPCGYWGDTRYPCRCPAQVIGLYRARVSEPLLDRVHLHVEVPAVTLSELRAPAGESSATVAARIAAARAVQVARFGAGSSTRLNGAMDRDEVRRHCVLDRAGRALLDAACEKLRLSARAVDLALQGARTIADLNGGGAIQPVHLAEAIQYQTAQRLLTSA
jgi:magnesium chelatase family protein